MLIIKRLIFLCFYIYLYLLIIRRQPLQQSHLHLWQEKFPYRHKPSFFLHISQTMTRQSNTWQKILLTRKTENFRTPRKQNILSWKITWSIFSGKFNPKKKSLIQVPILTHVSIPDLWPKIYSQSMHILRHTASHNNLFHKRIAVFWRFLRESAILFICLCSNIDNSDKFKQ